MKSIPIDRLLSRWYDWRSLLKAQTGSWRRAEAVLGAMRLQAVYGQCFATARFLGSQGQLSDKAWLRCLHQLRAAGLVQTGRRIRPSSAVATGGRRLGGSLGTLIVDLRRLWVWMQAVIKRLREDGKQPPEHRGDPFLMQHYQERWEYLLHLFGGGLPYWWVSKVGKHLI